MDTGTLFISVHFIISAHFLLLSIAPHLPQLMGDRPSGINCYCRPWVMMVGIQIATLMAFLSFFFFNPRSSVCLKVYKTYSLTSGSPMSSHSPI